MKKLLLLLPLLLMGCDTNVHKEELDNYLAKCEEHGGVASINNLRSRAKCMDGSLVGSLHYGAGGMRR